MTHEQLEELLLDQIDIVEQDIEFALTTVQDAKEMTHTAFLLHPELREGLK